MIIDKDEEAPWFDVIVSSETSTLQVNMTEAQIGTYSLEVILVESGPTADGVDVEERIKLVVAIIDPTSGREDELLADADADDVFVFNQTFVPKETTVKV